MNAQYQLIYPASLGFQLLSKISNSMAPCTCRWVQKNGEDGQIYYASKLFDSERKAMGEYLKLRNLAKVYKFALGCEKKAVFNLVDVIVKEKDNGKKRHRAAKLRFETVHKNGQATSFG